MNRPDAITRAQMPPSARGRPGTPILIGIIVTIIFFILLLLFMVIIPLSAEKSAEERSERVDIAVNQAVSQAMENVNTTGTIYQKEPSVPMSPGLLAIEEPFEEEQERMEREIDG